MNENTIIIEAIDRLTANTGIKTEWNPGNTECDGELTLFWNNKRIQAWVEIKNSVQLYHMNAIRKMANLRQPRMIVAERIPTGLKEELRKENIGYLDWAGNIYLPTADNIIWIEGNKNIQQTKPTTNRAFTKTGLRTLFYLLLHPRAINDPYRRLAETTGVALGNVKNIMEGLKAAGYTLPLDKKNVRLVKTAQLLERWIEGYRETLKPALYIGNYRFGDPNKFFNRTNLLNRLDNTVWGGEPAAEILTHHLTPAILTLYTDQPRIELMKAWNLIPDEKGNVRIYRKFWKDKTWDEQHVAPPLLIYADLLLTAEPRAVETAFLIYHQYLENELG